MFFRFRPAELVVMWSLCLFALTAQANPNKVVQLELEREGQFEVMYSRAKSSATGAVIGGLIGAGIEEGVRSGQDETRAKRVLEHLPDSNCHAIFMDSLTDRMMSRPEFSMASAVDESAALVLQIKISRCGFKLTGSSGRKVAAFLEARYRLYDPAGKKPRKMERLFLMGKQRLEWEHFVDDGALARSEFEGTLVAAGRRLANKVIYYKG